MSGSSSSRKYSFPSSEHDLQGVGLYGAPRPLPLPPEPSAYPEPVLEALPQPNRRAFIALALGLASLALGLVTGIPALIYGSLAYGEIRRSEGQQSGHAAAIAGIALGIVSLPLSVLYLLVLVGK